MGESQDEDKVLVLDVDDALRKASNQASSGVFVESLPGARELPNAIDCEEDLPEEFVSKAGFLAVVVIDRIVKLALGDLEESDPHLSRYSASTSSAETVVALPDR